MDFYLPSALPAGPTPREEVAPLIPRLDGALGPYSWATSLISETDTGSGQVNCDRSGFTVQVDVKHFSPEELVVKVIGHFVQVQGKHEEKKDGTGLVTRQFNRRYRIPEDVDAMALQSAVSPHVCSPAAGQALTGSPAITHILH